MPSKIPLRTIIASSNIKGSIRLIIMNIYHKLFATKECKKEIEFVIISLVFLNSNLKMLPGQPHSTTLDIPNN